MPKIEFDGLQNARDISYGRIKPGRLIRSEALTALSEADVAKLSEEYGLKAIIDLRTPEEAAQADMEVPGAVHYALPLMDTRQLGVTREEGNEAQMAASAKVPDLREVYLTFIGEDSKEAWTRIFDIFADTREGAVLWHCTAGKDRCGLVSAAVEHLLGLSEEQIMEDYLLSNEHPVVPEGLAAHAERMPEQMRRAFFDLFVAKEEYLRSAYDYIDANYGGMDGFLEQICGVDAEKRERIRANYLV